MRRSLICLGMASVGALVFAAAPAAFAAPAQSPPGSYTPPPITNRVGYNGGSSTGSGGQQHSLTGFPSDVLIPSQPQLASGYPCTWEGSHDLAHGATAFRNGKYADAVSSWQAAASKTCSVAAYKLALMYLHGSHVPVNHALGTAWMSVAANSRFTDASYVQLRNILLGQLDTAGRTQAHADYAQLRTRLALPVPQSDH